MVKHKMPLNIVEELLGPAPIISNVYPHEINEGKPIIETPDEALGKQTTAPSVDAQINKPVADEPTVSEYNQFVEEADAITEKQFVIFNVASSLYGLDIESVREIIRMQNITKLPGVPIFVEGVIDLRGKVVPVINLRKKLNLETVEQNNESRIVVVDITNGQIGVIVDAVTEVLSISASSIEPPSIFVASQKSDYMNGIAKIGDKMIILMDLSEMFSLAD